MYANIFLFPEYKMDNSQEHLSHLSVSVILTLIYF